MISRQDWLNEIEKGGSAICFHPEWLKIGCPKCGQKKWYLNEMFSVARCENQTCNFVTETLYPFKYKELEEMELDGDKITIDGM
jgi:hypothetical protein